MGRSVRLWPTSRGAAIITDEGCVPVHPTTHPTGLWLEVRDGEVVADPTLLLPEDGRGYSLRFLNGKYTAGCRIFSALEAEEHWSNPDHRAPASAARLLAAVRAHVAGEIG